MCVDPHLGRALDRTDVQPGTIVRRRDAANSLAAELHPVARHRAHKVVVGRRVAEQSRVAETAGVLCLEALPLLVREAAIATLAQLDEPSLIVEIAHDCPALFGRPVE